MGNQPTGCAMGGLTNASQSSANTGASTEAGIVATVLPQCAFSGDIPRPVLVEVSWTRRPAAVDTIAGETPPAGSMQDGKTEKKGTAYVLHVRAEDMATHKILADLEGKQITPRTLSSQGERQLRATLTELLARQAARPDAPS